MLALQLPHRARLAQKSLDRLGLPGHLGQQKFQRDDLLQVNVQGRHDHAHPALAEDALHHVLGVDPVARLQRLHVDVQL